jgi:hypothetical protein
MVVGMGVMRMISKDGRRVVSVVEVDGKPYYRVQYRSDAGGLVHIADERTLEGLMTHVDLADLTELRVIR